MVLFGSGYGDGIFKSLWFEIDFFYQSPFKVKKYFTVQAVEGFGKSLGIVIFNHDTLYQFYSKLPCRLAENVKKVSHKKR